MIIEHLIADSFGSYLGKYSGRLRLSHKDTVVAEAPLLHLQSVQILSNGVSFSSDALEACCEQGIPVFFLDGLGRCYASLYSAGLGATVITRREQLLAYHDMRGVQLALAVTCAKLHNQAVTLKYMAKNRKDSAPDVYHQLRDAASFIQETQHQLEVLYAQLQLEADAPISTLRDYIMGLEGSAGQQYWDAVRCIVPEQYAWQKREHRGATDAVNSLLNYGYGILYTRMEQALVLAGLDPYAGFLHADRPGKPSLVLDFIEEFRQIAVDRVVFGLLNRAFKVEQSEDGKLTMTTRRHLTEHILKHLETAMRYQDKRFPLRLIIQSQARRMAAFLRGEQSEYTGFMGDW